MQNSFLNDLLKLVPSFWRGIMWPTAQKNVLETDTLVGNLGLIGIAGFAYAFCQNVTKAWDIAIDATVLASVVILVPTILIFWCSATLVCRVLKVSDEHISSSISQFILLWSCNLGLLVVYNQIAFILGMPGGWEAWIFGDSCNTLTKASCFLQLDRLALSTFCASGLSLFIFYFCLRPIFKWLAPSNVREKFSEYPEFSDHKHLKSVIWILSMFVVLMIMNSVFHFMPLSLS